MTLMVVARSYRHFEAWRATQELALAKSSVRYCANVASMVDRSRTVVLVIGAAEPDIMREVRYFESRGGVVLWWRDGRYERPEAVDELDRAFYCDGAGDA